MWALPGQEWEAAMWITAAGLIVILFFVWTDVARLGFFGAAVVGGALLAYFNGGGLLGALAAGAVVCIVGAIVSFARFSSGERQANTKKLSVPCPTCGAALGAACVDAQGQPLAPHGLRTDELARRKKLGDMLAELD
jgi:hypothetical protein